MLASEYESPSVTGWIRAKRELSNFDRFQTRTARNSNEDKDLGVRTVPKKPGNKGTGKLFSYVDLEKRVRSDHPLRAIRGLVNEALVALVDEFSALYALIGRPSIPPEKLLRAMLLQAFYSIRSERQLMERLEYDLLFRWFVGIGVDAAVWDHSVFSKNRDRLLEGDIATRFLAAVLDQPRVKKLLSTEHFTVDGTLIEA